MAYKHIIWDWNGTLLNDRWLSIKAMNQVLSRRSLPPLTEKRYLEIFTFPVIDYYRRLGFDFRQEPFSVVGTEFIEEYTKRMFQAQLHSRSRELLEQLSASGMTHSLLSAASQTMLDVIIERHQLQPFFQNILGQDNHYAYGKEKVGEDWIREMEYEKREVLFIGDTLHDLEVAKKLEVNCILLSHGHTSYQRLVEAGGMVLRNMSELGKWFCGNLELDPD
jgi:phosphoglycolate phosphatase